MFSKYAHDLNQLRDQLKKIVVTKLEEDLKKTNLSPAFQCATINAVRQAKAKSASGMRYTTDWLLESVLRRIKAPKAYRHLRESKMLPLPSLSTITKLLNGLPCQFGTNEFALEAIRRQTDGKWRKDGQGVLSFDEIKLRESLDFNKGSLKFDGFIDFGYQTECFSEHQDRSRLADHALVLMYRPINANWVQPVASFATKNAASSHQLLKVVTSAICKLEAVGAEVLCVTSDGAKPNKGLWKLLGGSGNIKKVSNMIQHPTDQNRSVYFCCDIPHVFKCLRNHLWKYTDVKYNGTDVSFRYYECLYKQDVSNPAGLRKCPKLSRSHMWPNNFEKMKVSLATQVFSRSVDTGLQFYREMKVDGLQGSENTERFTLKLNDVFDALNATIVGEGLSLTSKKYQTLKYFQQLLCDNKVVNTFGSPETLNALSISIASTLEIIQFLIAELKYDYVLTAKLNQDCLEKFFGLSRSAGGCEDHPTVATFKQIYRLLSFYTPCKTVIRGNIRPTEAPDVLASFHDCLKQRAKELSRTKFKWKSKLETMLAEKLNWEVPLDLRGAARTQAQEVSDNLVYYVVGYTLYKQAKFVKCNACLNTLYSKNPGEDYGSRMTKIMEYKDFHLKYPSQPLFSIFRNIIEVQVGMALGSGFLFGDIVMDIVSALPPMNTSAVGCEEDDHRENLMLKLIPFYLQLRMYFYVKSMRNKIGTGKATKNKRKQSKLVST